RQWCRDRRLLHTLRAAIFFSAVLDDVEFRRNDTQLLADHFVKRFKLTAAAAATIRFWQIVKDFYTWQVRRQLTPPRTLGFCSWGTFFGRFRSSRFRRRLI